MKGFLRCGEVSLRKNFSVRLYSEGMVIRDVGSAEILRQDQSDVLGQLVLGQQASEAVYTYAA